MCLVCSERQYKRQPILLTSPRFKDSFTSMEEDGDESRGTNSVAVGADVPTNSVPHVVQKMHEPFVSTSTTTDNKKQKQKQQPPHQPPSTSNAIASSSSEHFPSNKKVNTAEKKVAPRRGSARASAATAGKKNTQQHRLLHDPDEVTH